jgi:hemerythrin
MAGFCFYAERGWSKARLARRIGAATLAPQGCDRRLSSSGGPKGRWAMTMTPDKESAFQLGQDALDREHQGQIDLLLAIETELGGAGDTARLAALLDQLIEYTNIHFMSEQVEMRQQVYPGLPAHEAEHDQLMEQMRDFQQRIASGERTLTAADISTLRDWVLRHIRSKDAAFAEYLIDNT